MTHYLVTGGAGFIGSHIVDALIEKGHRVTILDDLSTGNKKNINPEATFIKGSMTNPSIIDKAMEHIEAIFHLASQVSVIKAIENPEETKHINIGGTKILLEAAKKQNVKKIVLSTSSAVYGETRGPIAETALPHPLNTYASSKLAMEQLCAEAQQDNLTSCSLRYFNVYGPRQSPDSQYAAAIPIFIKCVLQGNPITVFGDGEQTRDFIFVQDVVNANLFAMEHLEGIYNIGTGNAISVNALIQHIESIAEKTTTVTYAEARDGEIKHSVADINKIKQTAYTTKTPIADGLRITTEDIQQRLTKSI